MGKMDQEAKKRRTFAIISHPDAGKTTLTEKLLLLGGAIRSAGAVKARKTGKFATSDWMELEKQRGISVTSSVMQFEYDNFKINILDTPGHQDFSEDTYRTLMAVDSVVMILDAAKGVEPQTKKLFKVCSDRGIPIFTFINKLDRVGKEPLELFEELEEVLGIASCPVNYPIGMGPTFKGVYDRFNNEVEIYGEGRKLSTVKVDGPESVREALQGQAEEDVLVQLEEELLLLEEAGNPFDMEDVLLGKLTPVFFGSAVSSFGVPTFLKHYLEMAPPPAGRESSDGYIEPGNDIFSGFIFKIQANMNPAHRDRIAFLRICSGKYEKGMETWLDRTGKPIKLAQPQQFFADSREVIEEAYPGDIVGVYDPGIYQIGDTLVGRKDTFNFGKLPQFSPEHFAKVRPKTALKAKHFQKGMQQLAQEGAVQVYKTERFEETVLGAVGQLQFDVFIYRMEAEYNVELDIQPLTYRVARWLNQETVPTEALRSTSNMVVLDQRDRPVILFENEFGLQWFQQKNPDISLSETSIS